MKMAHHVKVCFLVLVMCSLSSGIGCDTKTGPAGQPKPAQEKVDPDSPCILLSREDVEAVVKQKLQEPKRDDIICVYESVAQSPAVYLKVQLNPVEPAMFLQNRKDFEKKKSFKPVDGIGENAYFFNDELNILAKKKALSMGMQPGRSDEDLLALARKAVAKIK